MIYEEKSLLLFLLLIVFCFVVPIGYFINKKSIKRKYVALILFVIPTWESLLV